MRGFWIALGFLTILPTPPLGRVEAEEFRRAVACYPLVGYVVGAGLVGVFELASGFVEGLRGALVLAAWLALTGMLHLDGLLDSADALLAPRPPEARLWVLRDVHLGSFAFGVGSVHLLLKWQALAALEASAALVALPALARFWVLLPMHRYPAARGEGLGARARGGAGWRVGALFTLPAFVWAPGLALVVGGVVLLGAAWAARRLGGGLSGDVYGALIELGEVAGLLAWVGLTRA
ncbi:adenosylcobinamide-GDP ribazoletransferase [Marinithermus hydrothermalis]|uniref:Adenosylcobinamide-GDP ribazoletransferase n=1 Tax=Marinithermus hydrothermalis (strain DSM 14884 / JCM 11576 / T1) TaxID=869210 RepID=F2NMY2_MARHT|nr:adenosylcobinamide-GDP ribazoletransferase [Marinithermus hydrothermalis]AEB12721.1 Cobalamin synthase [Marinithermus hydrothermalis DSM 14884]